VQRAAAQSKTGIDHAHGAAEALPFYKAGWSDCIYFSLSLFVSFANLEFLSRFFSLKWNYEGTVPCRELSPDVLSGQGRV
jgi:hypothetical protein